MRAEKLYAEYDSIEKGILELISQYGIQKLVMGAAADKHYKKYILLMNLFVFIVFTISIHSSMSPRAAFL